jgi:replication factor A1
VPIDTLNLYTMNWAMKGKIIQKGEIRHFRNDKGEGKVTSMRIADESGEIRMNFFNQEVDRFVFFLFLFFFCECVE